MKETVLIRESETQIHEQKIVLGRSWKRQMGEWGWLHLKLSARKDGWWNERMKIVWLLLWYSLRNNWATRERKSAERERREGIQIHPERTNRAQLEQISKKGIQTNAIILFISFFWMNESHQKTNLTPSWVSDLSHPLSLSLSPPIPGKGMLSLRQIPLLFWH